MPCPTCNDTRKVEVVIDGGPLLPRPRKRTIPCPECGGVVRHCCEDDDEAPAAESSFARRELLDKLAAIYSPAEAEIFLDSPQALFGGEVPNRMIAAGRGAEVIAAIDRVLDGVFI